MLKKISKIISPELLKILCEMGHGDEIVIADANYPAHSNNKNVFRQDGVNISDLLKGILELFPLDSYVDINCILMEVLKGDNYKPVIWDEYKKLLFDAEGENAKIKAINKYEFYDRSKNAYAIVITGEQALYANLILKKGVII